MDIKKASRVLKKVIVWALVFLQISLAVPLPAFAANMTVTGVIVTSENVGIASTNISFYKSMSQDMPISIMTNESGVFSTADLTDGTYMVNLTIPSSTGELSPYSSVSITLATVEGTQTIVSANPSSILQGDGSLKFQSQLPQIVGKVTNPDGTDLGEGQNCSVNISANGGGSFYVYSTTDTSGIYKLAGLNIGGSYRLAISNCYGTDYVAPKEMTFTYTGPLNYMDANSKVLLKLVQPQLVGKMVNPDGSDISGMSGCSLALTGPNSFYSNANFDAAGVFKVANMSVGSSYVLRFSCYNSEFIAPNDVAFTYTTPINWSTNPVAVYRLQTPQITGYIYSPEGSKIIGGSPSVYLTSATGMVNKYTSVNYETGKFVFGGLEDGDYTMTLSSLNEVCTYIEMVRTCESKPLWLSPVPINVTVTDGAITASSPEGVIDIDGRVKAQYQNADKFIVGSVKYANGTPAERVRIYANMMGASHSTSVDAAVDGTFSIPVSTGVWSLNINNMAMGGNVDWVANGYSQNISVAATAGNYPVTGPLQFTVTAADATVSGHVYLGETGTVALEMNSFYINLLGGGQYGWVNYNPGDGSFTAKVPAGKYQLSLSSGKYKCPTIAPVVLKTGPNVIPPIRLTAKTEFISGKIVDEQGVAQQGVYINANSTAGTSWANAITDGEGSYVLPVGVGEWRVTPSSDPANDLFYTDGTVTKTLVQGETKSGVNFTLRKATNVLSGRLVDAQGDFLQEINDGYVWLGSRQVLAGVTDTKRGALREGGMGGGGDEGFSSGSRITNGTFSFKALPGSYKLHLGFSGNSPYSADPVSITVSADLSVSVVVKKANATIKGNLKNPQGQNVGGLYATVVMSDGTGSYKWASVDTVDGSFVLPVNSGGTYYIDTWVDPNTAAADGKYYVYNQGRKQINSLVAGENTRNIQLLEANTTLTGKVTDADGVPVTFAEVYANNNSSLAVGNYDNSVQTNLDGDYTIKLPTGTYSVGVGYSQDMLESGQMPPSKVTTTISTSNSPLTRNFQYANVDGVINGTVTGGNMYDRVTVAAWSDGGKSISKYVDYGRNYTLNVTDNETWHVSAVLESFNTSTGQRVFFRSPEYVTYVGDNQTKTQDIALSTTPQALPKAVSERFDSQEAKIITLEDGTKIDIPAGGLVSSGFITLNATAKAEFSATNSVKPVGIAYNLEATTDQGEKVGTFVKPVKITFPYTHAQVTALGITEDKLTAAYWDEASMTWKVSPNVSVDTAANTISVSVTHFSSWALISTNTGVTKTVVYRFWSDTKQHHFYTASAAEKDYVIANYPTEVWKYEGVSYNSYDGDTADLVPVFRFWSDTKQSHFYTSSQSEKDYIVASYSTDVWRYEGIAYYTYPGSSADTSPVYRFWSDTKQGHFYTNSAAEKDYVIANYPTEVWKYEGIAYYTPL